VSGAINPGAMFDLFSIPHEITDEFEGDFSFNLLEYTSTTFYESNSNTFTDYTESQFNNNWQQQMEFYYYSVPK
jgi:hypothetical protein